MATALNLRSIPATLLLFPLLAAPLAAQHVLVAQEGGKNFVVRAAIGVKPCVEIDGKLVTLDAHRFALADVPEYLPVFVSVRNINVQTTYMTTNKGDGAFNNDFHFNADFETGYHLSDVFVVLAMDTEQAGRALFLWEVGELEPNKVRGVSIVLAMHSPIGSSRYNLYLFSGGVEVLQTEIPSATRGAALDRMVAKRIRDVREAAPKLFVGLGPEYPPSLKKANLKGKAVISIRIGANGDVYDPVVKSATEPAFGEAALVAVRLWRFLPRVRDGYPIETIADVPVVFEPPIPTKDRS